ncbi:hypothetical protein DNU06_12590, partial [Putridiphycobacter roseus]
MNMKNTILFQKVSRFLFTCLVVLGFSSLSYSAIGHKTSLEAPAPSGCDLNSGTITGEQSSCGGFNPTILTSTAAASGGSTSKGAIEYQWMKTSASTSGVLTAIPGANSVDYDPPFITETTKYRRCARRAQCGVWWTGETVDLTITVNPALTASVLTTNSTCTTDTLKVCDVFDYDGNRTIWLPSFGGTSGVSLFTIVNNSGKLYQFKDGTAHFVGKAEKTNDANKMLYFSVWFKDKKDWTAWSATSGHGYKGNGTSANHTMWDYYMMDQSKENKITGLGDYAGLELDLTHKPSNGSMGMQLGLGANDQDASYGMSFWFDYTSTTPGYSGNGDFNTDLSGCIDQPSCGATAIVNIITGTAPYIYDWSNGQYGNEIKEACASQNSVTITDSLGCTLTESFTINNSQTCCANLIPGTIGYNQSNCGPFTPSVIVNLVSAIDLNGVGVDYVWMYRNATTAGVWTSTGVMTDTIQPGLITETTDFIRCVGVIGCGTYPGETNFVTMTVHPDLTLGLTATDATCANLNGGTATVNVISGNDPYSYLWNDALNSTTASLTGLTSGTYTVTVTDSNNCVTTDSVMVQGPLNCCNVIIPGTVGYSQTNCGPFTPATIVSLSPATNPFGIGVEYIWMYRSASTSWAWTSTGVMTDSIQPGLITETTHFVRCERNVGCPTYPAESNFVTITIHPLPVAVATATDALCNGAADGTATVNVTVGTAPYTYAWNNGGTTASLTGLVAGTYSVVVTDSNGCVANAMVTVNEPTDLTANGTGSATSCHGDNDGTVTVIAAGGTAPYTYAWSNGGTTATLTGLVAGTYTVTITDANGCTETAMATVTEPTSMMLSMTSSINNVCFGASNATATVVATGGTTGYTYLWNDASASTGMSATGLSAGTYTVIVTDANGCVKSDSVTFVDPNEMIATPIVSGPTCDVSNDGSASVSVTGGTAPYSYLWNDPAASTTSYVSGLAPGNYSVTITDATGCSIIQNITVVQSNVDCCILIIPGTVGYSQTNCGPFVPATIVSLSPATNITGGGVEYIWMYRNASTSWAWTSTGVMTDSIQPGLISETTDFIRCERNVGCPTYPAESNFVTITIHPLPVAVATATDALCNGAADGTATVNVTVGTAPYTYAWSNGGTTATLSGLVAGTYSVVVTDSNGCVANAMVTVIEPTDLTANGTGSALSCHGDNDGTVTVIAAGGTAPYTYAWS